MVLLLPNRLRGAVGLKRKAEFRAALAVFRRKMEAGADNTESQFAEGKHWIIVTRKLFFARRGAGEVVCTAPKKLNVYEI